jgi:hypothetical protein
VVTLPAEVEGSFGPAEVDDANTVITVPAIQDDFSGGALYSKRVIKNGYAYTAPGFARAARGVTPPGQKTSVTLPSPSPSLGAITDSFVLGNHLYFLAGRYALKLDSGTGSPTIDQDLGVGFSADGAAVFNGDAYVGGTGGNIWKLSSLGVWSQSADVTHSKAAVITWLIPTEGEMRARLVMGNSALTGIRYTGGDPMSLANWTPNPTSISVGDSSYPITSIIGGPNHVWIPKEDGFYDLNSRGETTNLTPDLARGVISDENGAHGIYHNNFVHLSHLFGSHRIDVSQSRRQYGAVWTLSPFGATNETPIIGPVTAYAIDQGWILAPVYNESLGFSYLMAGRNRGEPGVPDGPGAMLWHGAEAVISGRITCLAVTAPNGVPRVWMASRQGASTRLAWQYLPSAVNPMAELVSDTGFRFGSDLLLYTTAFDWGDPDAKKVLRVIGLRADGLGASVSIAVSANAEGGDFTVQTESAQTSPRTRISPRAPLTEGHEIGILLVGDGTGTSPPVVRALKLDAEMINEQFDRRYYPIVVAKGQDLRGSTPDNRNHQELWNSVTNLHIEGVLEMQDRIQDQVLNVRVHPIPKYKAREDQIIGGYVYEALLGVTVLEILEGSAIAGVQWGSGVQWGQDGLKWGGS